MDKLYHAIAKTISLFKKGQYDSKTGVSILSRIYDKTKIRIEKFTWLFKSNFDPPKKLAIFDPLPQATFFFCLF